MRGELLTAPRLKNPKIPAAISDIVVKALAPEIPARYQRAGDLLDDVLLGAHRRAATHAAPRSGRPAASRARRRQTMCRRSTVV